MANEREDNSLLWVLGLTIGVVLLYYWFFYNSDDLGVVGDVTQAIDDVVNGITRGKRLTNAPYDKSTGLVPGSPSDLAASCGMDVETYSLARAIASEEAGSTNATKVAVGWAIKNAANQKYGGSITTLVCTADGSYGIQPLVGYCSTAHDPYEGEGTIAEGIQSGAIADTTDGATQFDRPAGENAAKVQAKRIASGATQVTPEGTLTPGLEFWTGGKL